MNNPKTTKTNKESKKKIESKHNRTNPMIGLFFIFYSLCMIVVQATMSNANQERTFLMIKPDGVQRGLIGEIIQRFESKGFQLIAMKVLMANDEILQQHYQDLADRPFFPSLIEYMKMGPIVPMVWQGLNVVRTGRQMLGETNPADSKPGTIRGDLCIQTGRNIIHGSDSIETAEREIDIWFEPEELIQYSSSRDVWIYE